VYAIEIVNSGNTQATGVVYEDLLTDPNLTLVPGTVQTNPPGLTVTEGNTAGDTTVEVQVGTIAGGGGTVVISYKATIRNPLVGGATQVANQGVVDSNELPDEPTDDPDTAPDDDPTVTPVTANPVLEAEKTDLLFTDADNNGVPSPGDTLVYAIEIVNSGNTQATGVVYEDLLTDPNLALVVGSVQTSHGTVTSGNTAGDTSVVVDVGTIPGGGGSVDISYQGTIAFPVPAGTTQVANQGVVTSNELPDEPTDDPETGPDDDPTVTPVLAAPVLEAEKTDSLRYDADGNGVPSPGDTLLYEVVIDNFGNTGATDVVFNDTPGEYTTLLVGSVNTSQGTVTSGNTAGDTSVAVDVGAIPAGGQVTIYFQVTIDDGLPPGVTQVANQGIVDSVELPDEPTDDPDTAPDDDPTETPVEVAPVGGITLPLRVPVLLAPWIRLAALFGLTLVSVGVVAWRWKTTSR
jgi:uncharacterized repeat protein (TIGR01451 family)